MGNWVWPTPRDVVFSRHSPLREFVRGPAASGRPRLLRGASHPRRAITRNGFFSAITSDGAIANWRCSCYSSCACSWALRGCCEFWACGVLKCSATHTTQAP